ncbi:ribosome small subunit-dependent GTPase A [Actinomadura sp. HBU206391]|uniref:ribosome small subunit-dependent GTPase A n=1 Tax=Actinomadura sp. HBU206391 TaxID=2731692 RepID=UPI00164F3A14|nr:ribosome small subunit-dependent GTPase A [Actinomadura sp. HBU206391]MBC6462113.1 ribosome small subunit-dependent GTPase A [Actinomadura sp. HBU206391]
MVFAENSAFDLFDLGWDDGWAAAFAACAADDGLTAARVARVDKGACDILSGEGEARALIGGELRRAAAEDPVDQPCVGDWAVVRIQPDGGRKLVAVLPRRTAIVRGGVGRESRGGLSADSRGQVLAANVDVVYVVEPAAHEPGDDSADLGRIERLLTLAWESGALPVVLVTKADLAGDLPGLLDRVIEAAPGADVHAVSSLSGSGLEPVRLHQGRTAVLLGPSGAGKSTLVNALADADLMATQRVRASDGRGRHTTTHRELLMLPGSGLVIDTPGLRRVGLYDADAGLAQTFSDIEELAEGCRFSDCAHDGEPDCAVRAAVESGELPRRRLDSWHKLRREAAWMAGRTDARLRAEQTRRWKIIHKEMRRSGRNRP